MVLGEPAEVDPVARQRMYAIPTEAENASSGGIEPHHAPPAAETSIGGGQLRRLSVLYRLPRSHRPRRHAPMRFPITCARIRGRAIGMLLAACAAVLLLAVGFLLTSGFCGWFGGTAAIGRRARRSTLPAIFSRRRPPRKQTPAVPAPTTSEPPTASTSNESDAAVPTMPASPPRLQLPSMGVSAASSTEPEACDQGRASPQKCRSMSPLTATEKRLRNQPRRQEQADRYTDAEFQLGCGQRDGEHPTRSSATDDVHWRFDSGIRRSETENHPRARRQCDRCRNSATGRRRDHQRRIHRRPSRERSRRTYRLPRSPPNWAPISTARTCSLRYDSAAGAWFRMTPRSTLRPGDKLLALPAFYPTLDARVRPALEARRRHADYARPRVRRIPMSRPSTSTMASW